MTLTTEEKILIEQRVQNDAKSAGVAYALWFFTGTFGGHRYYLGRTRTAVAMTLIAILGFLLCIVGIGVFILLALGIWVLVDAFLIPGMITRQKEALRSKLSAEAAPVASAEPEAVPAV